MAASKGTGSWNEDDWNYFFEEAKIDGCLLISKVDVPNQFQCDHRDSTWVFY